MCIYKKTAYNSLAKKMTAFAIIFFIYLLTSISVYSDVPVIKNLNYNYIGDEKIIKILYDLAYPGSGGVNISIVASNDGGKTFNIIPMTVNGDIGNVMPGTGKQINWKILTDYPSIDPLAVKIRLLASDADHNLTYFSAGGTDMVLIPAGTFRMGSYDTPDGMPIYGDELPDHYVTISNSFYMDTHEVTNAQYAEFLIATGRQAPLYWNDPRFNDPNKPVVGVTWEDAVAYCNWVGKRLPTEAEWEMAARGGQVSREFPWGNTIDRRYGNFASVEGPDVWYDTAPIRSFLPNDFGLFDMIGNAYEWCSDYYDFSYYSETPSVDPQGPSDPQPTRVIRGGSCYDGFFPSYLRHATRFSYDPNTRDGIIGFRCVMDIPK